MENDEDAAANLDALELDEFAKMLEKTPVGDKRITLAEIRSELKVSLLRRGRGRQTNRQTNRQTERQAGRQIETHWSWAS
jgi:hypothetical protein